jgi:hypothetical protein
VSDKFKLTVAKKIKTEQTNAAAQNEPPTGTAAPIETAPEPKKPAAKKTAAKKPTATKAAAKKSATKKSGKKVPAKATAPKRRTGPSDEQIRIRAYFIAERRMQMALDGDPANDWIQARQELIAELGQNNGNGSH